MFGPRALPERTRHPYVAIIPDWIAEVDRVMAGHNPVRLPTLNSHILNVSGELTRRAIARTSIGKRRRLDARPAITGPGPACGHHGETMARVNYRHQKNLREQLKKKRNDEKRLKKEKLPQAANSTEPVEGAPSASPPGVDHER
jgi:hypothetical protein